LTYISDLSVMMSSQARPVSRHWNISTTDNGHYGLDVEYCT